MSGRAVNDAGSVDNSAAADALAAVRGGDAGGLARLADLFGRAMTRAAYLLLGDGHAAEDVAHDALIAAWDSSGRTGPQTPVRAWLLGIVLNLCRAHRRGFDRRRRREQAVSELRPEAGIVRGDEFDRLEALARAMDGLDPPLREVVVLRFQQQLDVAETAAALGIPEGTVKSRTHSAMRQLREALTGWEESP